MDTPEPRVSNPQDHSLEQILGYLLRGGVLLSAFILLLGGTIYLWRHGREPVIDRHLFSPEPPEYSYPLEILRAANEFQGRALVQLGLLFLIATPVMRVVITLIIFARRKNLIYTLFTLIVLVVLCVGFFAGIVGH